MSQHDLVIDNQTFSATRADINSALQALGSLQSGSTAPSTTYAHQPWLDTSTNELKIRNSDDDAWISVLSLDQTADLARLIAGVRAPDGSASAPSFSFGSDTNTGFYRSGADQLSAAVNGARALLLANNIARVIGSAPSLQIKDNDNTGSAVTGKLQILESDDSVAAEIEYSASQLRIKVDGTEVANFSNTQSSLMPTGSVIQFAGTTPSGWVECDGSEISRTEYANLFAVIGTSYGSGDGSTTFNVPTVADDGSVGHIIKV